MSTSIPSGGISVYVESRERAASVSRAIGRFRGSMTAAIDDDESVVTLHDYPRNARELNEVCRVLREWLRTEGLGSVRVDIGGTAHTLSVTGPVPAVRFDKPLQPRAETPHRLYWKHEEEATDSTGEHDPQDVGPA